MAVPAHPDDEASSTGGVLALYSGEGIRTIVVTCTNGEFGDAPGGIKPGEPGHDEQAVAQLRLSELRESTKILGVSELETLGYHDSGMPDWEYKFRPDAFSNVPLAEVADRIGGLIDKYRPQIVITSDEKGPYQHPDHLHASLAAQAAVAQSDIPDKLYLSAMRSSSFEKIRQALRDAGEDVPEWDTNSEEAKARAKAAVESEARITTTVDIRSVLDIKRQALFAHASQIAESWFAKVPQALLSETFGFETFIRAADNTGAPLPETDLFAGLR
jgi:LmbE family N-acetylglucosaminyl deacetylase